MPWVDRDIMIGNRFAQEHETVTNSESGEMLRTIGQCTGPQVKRSGFKTWQGQCFMFLGKTHHSHGVSLDPRV